jgi:hypothetical protein
MRGMRLAQRHREVHMKNPTQRLKNTTHALSIGALLALASFALPASAASGTFTTHTATFTGCLADGTCYAGVSPILTTANTDCAFKDQVRWSVSTAGGKEMARNATAGVLSGKTITIHTLSTCLNGYAQIDQVSINQ